MLQVLEESEDLIIINKPNGLAVHRSKLVGNTQEFALQQLRDQIGQHVYPVHRLDRKTSGILVFSKSGTATALIQKALESATKTYLAIVRGHTADQGTIDKPLLNDSGKLQQALTLYKTLQKAEIEVAHGAHSTSRYSLVKVTPRTGRMHQIRKHFNHMRHPIIGDRPHGCNKQNKLFKEKWSMNTMLLHSAKLEIQMDPQQDLIVRAPIPAEFDRMMGVLKFDRDLLNL